MLLQQTVRKAALQTEAISEQHCYSEAPIHCISCSHPNVKLDVAKAHRLLLLWQPARLAEQGLCKAPAEHAHAAGQLWVAVSPKRKVPRSKAQRLPDVQPEPVDQQVQLVRGVGRCATGAERKLHGRNQPGSCDCRASSSQSVLPIRIARGTVSQGPGCSSASHLGCVILHSHQGRPFPAKGAQAGLQLLLLLLERVLLASTARRDSGRGASNLKKQAHAEALQPAKASVGQRSGTTLAAHASWAHAPSLAAVRALPI